MRFFADDDLVILDDFGSSGANEWRTEVLFEFVDYRYREKKKTIVTTNLSRNKIATDYSKRLASRLFASENVHIDLSEAPDLRAQGL